MELVVDRLAGQGGRQPVERAAPVASGVDGAPADVLDELEHGIAGLLANDLAEHPTEQADVVAEGGILARSVGRGGVLGGWLDGHSGHHRTRRTPGVPGEPPLREPSWW